MGAAMKFYNCEICLGDGYEYEWVEDKREKRPCPSCKETGYLSFLEMVKSGYADKMDAKVAVELGNKACDKIIKSTKQELLVKLRKELEYLTECMPLAFTSDDLWARLDEQTATEISARGGNVIGAIFKEANRANKIEDTGQMIKSSRLRAKGRKVSVWRKCNG